MKGMKRSPHSCLYRTHIDDVFKKGNERLKLVVKVERPKIILALATLSLSQASITEPPKHPA